MVSPAIIGQSGPMTANHRYALPRTRQSSVWALTAAVVAIAGFFFSAEPAPATSTNHTWMYLHFPATDNDARCIWRWITTGPGHYRSQMFNYHWAHPAPPANPRRIFLRRATYRWVDCWEAQGPRVYRHYSRLLNESHGPSAC